MARTTESEVLSLLVTLASAMGGIAVHVHSDQVARRLAALGANGNVVVNYNAAKRSEALKLNHEAGFWRVRRYIESGGESDWGPACTTLREMALALRMAINAVHTTRTAHWGTR